MGKGSKDKGNCELNVTRASNMPIPRISAALHSIKNFVGAFILTKKVLFVA